MNQSELEAAVLEFVGRPNYKPAKPRAIAKKLGLDENEAEKLRTAVKSLVKSGRIAYASNHLLVPVAATSKTTSSESTRTNRVSRKEFAGDRVTGVFRRMSAGYGFVRPDGAAPAADRSGDIFIAANHAGDAASGDTVLVAVSRKRDIRRGNREGEIVEILEQIGRASCRERV